MERTFGVFSYYFFFLQTHVQGNLFGMFRDDKLFPEPETFKPERWLKGSQMNQEIKALSNLVWGHGARMCIGKSLSDFA